MTLAAAAICLASAWHKSGLSLSTSTLRAPRTIVARSSLSAKTSSAARMTSRATSIVLLEFVLGGAPTSAAKLSQRAVISWRRAACATAAATWRQAFTSPSRTEVPSSLMLATSVFAAAFPVENSGQSRSPAAARLIASRASPFSKSPGGISTDRLASAGRSASREAHSFKRSRSITNDGGESPLTAARRRGSIHDTPKIAGCVAANFCSISARFEARSTSSLGILSAAIG